MPFWVRSCPLAAFLRMESPTFSILFHQPLVRNSCITTANSVFLRSKRVAHCFCRREVSRQWPTGEDIVPRCLLPDDADTEDSATWCDFRLWVKNCFFGTQRSHPGISMCCFTITRIHTDVI